MAFSVFQSNFDTQTVSQFGTMGLTSTGSVGGGVYSIDVPNFNYSFYDQNGGFPSDIISSTLNAFAQPNPAIQILSYTFHFLGQPDAPIQGAQFVAYNSNSVLVQKIDGFNNLGHGKYTGTLNPGQYLLFSGTDLSTTEPGYAGPALPILLGTTGTFDGFNALTAVPEPSTALLIAAAALVFLVARLPIFAGFRSTRAAA